ncbi:MULTISPECIES: hypothetical protein [unclassified Pseudomonas]|nr:MULTISPECIES: hypothetical protein [unclassified Pseudomonas]
MSFIAGYSISQKRCGLAQIERLDEGFAREFAILGRNGQLLAQWLPE